jgi:hypothetical protein
MTFPVDGLLSIDGLLPLWVRASFSESKGGLLGEVDMPGTVLPEIVVGEVGAMRLAIDEFFGREAVGDSHVAVKLDVHGRKIGIRDGLAFVFFREREFVGEVVQSAVAADFEEVGGKETGFKFYVAGEKSDGPGGFEFLDGGCVALLQGEGGASAIAVSAGSEEETSDKGQEKRGAKSHEEVLDFLLATESPLALQVDRRVGGELGERMKRWAIVVR